VINTKVDGIEAYATSDLLEEHPEKPGYWRIYGRSDDQIIHSTGEKVCMKRNYFIKISSDTNEKDKPRTTW